MYSHDNSPIARRTDQIQTVKKGSCWIVQPNAEWKNLSVAVRGRGRGGKETQREHISTKKAPPCLRTEATNTTREERDSVQMCLLSSQMKDRGRREVMRRFRGGSAITGIDSSRRRTVPSEFRPTHSSHVKPLCLGPAFQNYGPLRRSLILHL